MTGPDGDRIFEPSGTGGTHASYASMSLCWRKQMLLTRRAMRPPVSRIARRACPPCAAPVLFGDRWERVASCAAPRPSMTSPRHIERARRDRAGLRRLVEKVAEANGGLEAVLRGVPPPWAHCCKARAGRRSSSPTRSRTLAAAAEKRRLSLLPPPPPRPAQTSLKPPALPHDPLPAEGAGGPRDPGAPGGDRSALLGGEAAGELRGGRAQPEPCGLLRGERDVRGGGWGG